MDLIDRAVLIKAISTRQCGNIILEIMQIKALIAKAPTVDAAPVVHGRWIYDHWCEFRCSVCGHYSTTEPRAKENYCPNCGAKMDEEGDK